MTRDEQLTWEQAVCWLRSQPEHHELVKACFYDDPLYDSAKRYYSSSEWSAVKKLIPETPSLVLDVGAGRGVSSYALAMAGWQVTALEPDISKIVGSGAIRQLAKEAALNIHVVEEWGESIPFKDESFDLIHCRQALHHANDLPSLCKELGRVLKPAGRFIATREHVISKKADPDTFLKSHPLHHLYGGENAYMLKEYKDSIRMGKIKLTHVFNTYQSNINLFPETRESVKIIFANKLKFHNPALLPDFLLGLIGYFINTPGQPYTFVGTKMT